MEPRTRNIGAFLKVATGVPTKAGVAGTVNGAAIDRLGYQSCVLSASNGAATGTPTSYTLDNKLQDSPDGSTGWADLANAALTQITTDNSRQSKNIDLSGAKRYLRVVQVITITGGTSPTVPADAEVVLGGADTLPAV